LRVLDDVEGAADVDGGLHVDADHGADLLAAGGDLGGLLERQVLADVEPRAVSLTEMLASMPRSWMRSMAAR
jgi:hypothetical protein